MYLFGDPSHDGRVIREATSLATAGHEVTLLARLRAADRAGPPGIPGVRLVDVRSPGGTWLLGTAIRRPWRLGPWVARSLASLRRPRPSAVGRAALGILLLPWIAIGTVWHGVRSRGGRPGDPGGRGVLDYLLLWLAPVRAWGRAAASAAPAADVHHAHDLSALPAAIAAARRGGSVVYDSHEIFLESGRHARQPRWLRHRLEAWERRMTRGAAAVVTVNEGVAAELERRLVPRRLVVVHNCPPRRAGPGKPELRVRARLGLADDIPLAGYHGGFAAHRGLEVLAAAIREPGLARVHLAFMGYGPERPLVLSLAADARAGSRIHVLDPVAPSEVVDALVGTDVAVMPIAPSTRNHVLSTPNKLFEALAAGVPVVVSDFPEMHRIVLDDPEGPLGVVCDPASPAAVAVAIRAVLDQPPEALAAMRARCRRAAEERWNWETESARLVALYADLEAGGGPTPVGPPA